MGHSMVRNSPSRRLLLKSAATAADLVAMSVNATSSISHANQTTPTSQPAARTAQSQTEAPKNGPPGQDTVTLSRAAQLGSAAQRTSADADHDGDNH